MKKQMVMIVLLLGFSTPSLSLSEGKTLYYAVNNHQDDNIVLQCNILHLTGEKESSFVRSFSPGKTSLFMMQNLGQCNGSVVVRCKLKKTRKDYGLENFWISIPCEQIDDEKTLELNVSKEDKLSSRYVKN